MSKQVLCVLFFGVVVSGVLSCCVPKQWEALQGIATGYIQDGKPHSLEGSGIEKVEVWVPTNGSTLPLPFALYNVSFDAMNKKVRVAGSMNTDGKPMDQMVLQDYSMMPGKQYVITGGKCYKSDLNGPFPQTCLSSAAKMTVSSYVGSGMNKIMVNAYKDMIDGMMTDITVTKDCIPVTASQKTNGSVTFINYMGLTSGIKDMSVFNIPKICMMEENTSTVNHQRNVRSSAFFHHF